MTDGMNESNQIEAAQPSGSPRLPRIDITTGALVISPRARQFKKPKRLPNIEDAPNPGWIGPDVERYSKSVEQAIEFLRSSGQSADGSYSSDSNIAITAFATFALSVNGVKTDDPLIAKSLSYLIKFVQTDGGIYRRGGLFSNFETGAAVLCLAATAPEEFKKLITSAVQFMCVNQYSEENGRSPDDFAYGGIGYGTGQRPDLVNTSMLVYVLRASGFGPEDAPIQRAVRFISRCQNYVSGANTAPWAAKNPDGGFVFTCDGDGGSRAGKTENGGWISYGSATCNAVMNLLRAGVPREDPRIQIGLRWIREHYSLMENTGMGEGGLYGCYYCFSKVMCALGEDYFETKEGKRIDWRFELSRELFRRQSGIGYWQNDDRRLMEGDPNLTTSLALLTLWRCRPTQKPSGSD